MDFKKEYNESVKIVYLNEDNISLSETYLSSNIEALMDLGTQFRLELDKEVKNKEGQYFSYFKHLPDFVFDKYPIGRCVQISNAFLKYIENNSPQFLSDYLNKGGLLKRVWGSLREDYFQTSIQIGHYILDVAHDTVDPKVDKIFCFKVGDRSFKNLTSFDDFIKIKRSYHKVDIILNTIVPEIYFLYPILQRKNGVLSFQYNPNLSMLIEEGRDKVTVKLDELTEGEIKKIKRFFTPIVQQKLSSMDIKKKSVTIKKMITLFK